MSEKLFHVLNRGVDKRTIFLEDEDYFRFIHDLFEFNDIENVDTTYYQFYVASRRKIDGNSDLINLNPRRVRTFLVNIHAFCLMPNHYHLLLSERKENGMAKFMKKLNMGYTRYFNEKNERQGSLFEGTYKRIEIVDDSHFIHLPYYIHLNPLDLKFPSWRERELKDYKKAISSLEQYRWSSHLDYLGIKNFPSVTQRDFLNSFFGDTQGYKSNIQSWLKDLSIDSLGKVLLE